MDSLDKKLGIKISFELCPSVHKQVGYSVHNMVVESLSNPVHADNTVLRMAIKAQGGLYENP